MIRKLKLDMSQYSSSQGKYYLYLKREGSKGEEFLPSRQWLRALPRCSLFHMVDKIHPAVLIHPLFPPG